MQVKFIPESEGRLGSGLMNQKKDVGQVYTRVRRKPGVRFIPESEGRWGSGLAESEGIPNSEGRHGLSLYLSQ